LFIIIEEWLLEYQRFSIEKNQTEDWFSSHRMCLCDGSFFAPFFINLVHGNEFVNQTISQNARTALFAASVSLHRQAIFLI
jgi:hypothetical protein